MRDRLRRLSTNTYSLRKNTFEANRLAPVDPTYIAAWSGVVDAMLNVDILLVGGGGSGGAGVSLHPGGGGGAGYVDVKTNVTLSITDFAYTPDLWWYNVEIGSGGAGSVNAGAKGQNSQLYDDTFAFALSAEGGGLGARGAATTGGGSGASGGGAAGATASRSGGSATNVDGTSWGSNGGANYSDTAGSSTAGGGGGRSAVGDAGSSTKSGDGGAGVVHWGFLVGGGGGGGRHNTAAGDLDFGQGGSGIGGYGDTTLAGYGRNGVANTGSGGGGGNGTSTATAGGDGGSGLIVIRYAGQTQKAQGGQIFTDGQYVYHVFTSSGIFSLEVFGGASASQFSFPAY